MEMIEKKPKKDSSSVECQVLSQALENVVADCCH